MVAGSDGPQNLWEKIVWKKHKLLPSLAASFSLKNSASPRIKDRWETIGRCFLELGELKWKHVDLYLM